MPEHTVVEPVIVPGFANEFMTFTVRVRGELNPQPLPAATDTTPPELLVVVVIELLVLVPVHPEGSVQV